MVDMCFENDDQLTRTVMLFDGDKVPRKLELNRVDGATSSLGACYESPPDYCESDPLQGNGDEREYQDVHAAHSSVSSDTASTGSFSEDDDDLPRVDANRSWSELGYGGRAWHVFLHGICKFIGLVALLYFFICSLDILSSSFRILGGKTAGKVFASNELLSNPVAGLMIGVLATVLVQSSSTSTSIIVTMVASGIISVRPAIPIIMGANIGTSITNTIVSMAQSGNRREFQRAFAGATVHDMFNWLTALTLLPLEMITGYLFHLTKYITEACQKQSYKGYEQELLTALTKPLTSLIVLIDKEVISKIAEGHEQYQNRSLIQKYCVFGKVNIVQNVTMAINVTSVNSTENQLINSTIEMNLTEPIGIEKCTSLFSIVDIGDPATGWILLVVSLTILCSCLVMMVKLLNSMLRGSIAKVIRKTLNSDFPGCFSWLTGYAAMLVGAVMTILVQSSSVFTSALTPFVGIGMIKVERMYPLTLGSNIGTTATGLLAAMAATGDKLPIALQIALCHLFFNVSGILLFYPVVPLRQLPIKLAKFLGAKTAKYRWFAIAYIIFMFFLLPACVFSLSLAGFIPFICVVAIVLPLVVAITILNVLQRKCSKCLPKKFRTWKFLPIYLRSLQPIDNVISKLLSAIKKYCPCCQASCQKQDGPSIGDIVKSVIGSEIRVTIPINDLKQSPISSVASSRQLLERVV